MASIKNKIIILTQVEFGELGKIRNTCISWAWQVLREWASLLHIDQTHYLRKMTLADRLANLLK